MKICISTYPQTRFNPMRKSLADAELRKRERWDVPATKSLRVSYAALALSVVAIAVSIWDKLA